MIRAEIIARIQAGLDKLDEHELLQLATRIECLVTPRATINEVSRQREYWETGRGRHDTLLSNLHVFEPEQKDE